jgi:hypothetical protein
VQANNGSPFATSFTNALTDSAIPSRTQWHRIAVRLAGGERYGVGLAPASHRGLHRDPSGLCPSEGTISTRRSPGRGVIGYCRRQSASAARSQPGWCRCCWSASLALVDRIAMATRPATQRWAWWPGVNSSLCHRRRRGSLQSWMPRPRSSGAICRAGRVGANGCPPPPSRWPRA